MGHSSSTAKFPIPISRQADNYSKTSQTVLISFFLRPAVLKGDFWRNAEKSFKVWAEKLRKLCTCISRVQAQRVLVHRQTAINRVLCWFLMSQRLSTVDSRNEWTLKSYKSTQKYQDRPSKASYLHCSQLGFSCTELRRNNKVTGSLLHYMWMINIPRKRATWP